MPTFLAMNNLNIPKEVKGKSLLDLLKKDSNIYTALYGYWGGGMMEVIRIFTILIILIKQAKININTL